MRFGPAGKFENMKRKKDGIDPFKLLFTSSASYLLSFEWPCGSWRQKFADGAETTPWCFGQQPVKILEPHFHRYHPMRFCRRNYIPCARATNFSRKNQKRWSSHPVFLLPGVIWRQRNIISLSDTKNHFYLLNFLAKFIFHKSRNFRSCLESPTTGKMDWQGICIIFSWVEIWLWV